MLRNYVVIALRLLVKNKVFSFINIIGLSIGIACCIIITLYVQEEFSYESGFRDRDKIFRINTTFVKDGTAETGPHTSPPIAIELGRALPEIAMATRAVRPLGVEQHIIRYGDKSFFEKEAFLVDSSFFDLFDYEFIDGDRSTVLDAPSTVVISSKLKETIFGDRSPVDELLIINSGANADTFRVTGVLAEPKFPSHLDAQVYMSMQSNGWGEWVLAQTTWANNNVAGGYLKLNDPESYKSLESKFPEFVERYAGAELKASGRGKILKLQPIDDIRLFSEKRAGSEAQGSITYVYIIGTIGVLILLLACINFMNLTTARSAQRSGEVGIRKSMGAYKSNLIRQFLGESFVIVCFALIVSLLIVVLGLPVFNNIMQKNIQLTTENLPLIIGATLVICIITALLAGSYPAFFLSALKPTDVLKGRATAGGGSQWLRKGLVVFQFVITITLISSIIIIQKQLNYIQTKSLGFNTEQVIMIPLRTQQSVSQYETIKGMFSNIAGVNVVSGTSSVPSTPLFRDWGVYKQGSSNEQSLRHEIVSVDEAYFKMLDIPMIEGRDFIPGQDNVAGDTINTTKVVVNEASLKALNIPLQEAVGYNLYFQPDEEVYTFTIIGVVKDFHQFSLHREISPMLFMLPGNRNSFPYLAASIRMEDYQRISKEMKSIWDERINDTPFESIFLNQNLKKLYASEDRTSTMLSICTTIALIISCLGLYGLSVFVAERRTKEIGIRKVVGASVESIVGMLSGEYVKLILISFVLSIPLGYYAMDKWLQGFAYKVEPGITVFLISGAVAFLISWVTISFESFRAATRNPVDTFRTN